MARFNRGETVKSNLAIKDSDGNLTDPSSIPLITITDPDGTVIQNEQDMTFSAVGRYYYLLQTDSDNVLGRYEVKYKVVDGVLTSILYDYFNLGT